MLLKRAQKETLQENLPASGFKSQGIKNMTFDCSVCTMTVYSCCFSTLQPWIVYKLHKCFNVKHATKNTYTCIQDYTLIAYIQSGDQTCVRAETTHGTGQKRQRLQSQFDVWSDWTFVFVSHGSAGWCLIKVRLKSTKENDSFLINSHWKLSEASGDS